jgi:hypothetical protein
MFDEIFFLFNLWKSPNPHHHLKVMHIMFPRNGLHLYHFSFASLALPPNPNGVPTLQIQPIPQTPPTFIEPICVHTFALANKHIDHDLLKDPFDQVFTSIPSPSRISSSPHYSI